jgi:hypothetical protein
MRSGTAFAIYMGTLFNKRIGVGGRFDGYWSSRSDASLFIKDKVSLIYVGGAFQLRAPLQPGSLSHFYLEPGVGLAVFNEETTYKGTTSTFTAVGLPLRASIGFHIQVAKPMAVHFGVNAMVGAVTGTIDNETVNENITRVGAAAGLSFTF